VAEAATRLFILVTWRAEELRDEECFADLDELLALARVTEYREQGSALPCYTTESNPLPGPPYRHEL